MELRMCLCCDAEYREDSLQNWVAALGRLPATTLVPNAKTVVDHHAATPLDQRRYKVLHRCGGGSVILSPSRLSFLALSPSRLSPLARSPSRYSSGFSERDVVLSAFLSEFRGCMHTTWYGRA